MSQTDLFSKATRRLALIGMTAMAACMLIFVIWSALAPLQAAVVTTGLVKARNNRQAVQHPDGGVIKALLVRDGDVVKAGQPLLELEGIGNDASYQLTREFFLLESVKLARLHAEQLMKVRFDAPGELQAAYPQKLLADAMQREIDLLGARRQNLDDQIQTLEKQLLVIAGEQTAILRQMKATQDALGLSQDSLNMNQSLYDQQFVSKSRLLTEERTVVDYEARLHEFEATLSQARQRENDVRLRMAAAKNSYQQQAHEEQRESGRRLAELRERLKPLESQVQRQVIASPVEGQVVGSRYFGASQVVGPRDVIMQIVPKDDELIVDVQIPVDDIKSVRPGQEASLRLTAYDARTTPRIRGKLTYVSADALNDKDGRPYYQAHILPDSSELARIVAEPLQPGMAAEVFILTRERTALEFLLDPVKQALDRSMRER